MRHAALAWVLLALAGSALGGEGVDLGFGAGGIAVVPVMEPAKTSTYSIALDPAGRTVVAGTGPSSSTVLTRFLADGKLDTSFGAGGFTEPIYGSFARVRLDREGRILVASAGSIVRLLSNGRKNESFGASVPRLLRDVVELPSGALLAFGEDELFRFRPDGSRDPTFIAGGQVGTPRMWRSFALSPDGRVFLAGLTPLDGRLLVEARFIETGAPDPTFGTGGFAEIGALGRWAVMSGILVVKDGRIVLAGSVPDPADPTRSVLSAVRLDSSGRPDASFGNAGVVRVPTSVRGAAPLVLEAPTSRLLLIGAAQEAGALGAVVHLRPDGSLDSEAGADGVLVVRLGPGLGGESLVDGALTQDGKLLLGGQVVRCEWPVAALARVDGRGLDPTFGENGVVTSSLGWRQQLLVQVRSLLTAGDGKVLVTLETDDALGRVAVFRFGRGGALDRTFGYEGRAIVRIGVPAAGCAPEESQVGFAARGVVDPRGRLLFIATLSSAPRALVRLEPNGRVDKSFGREGAVDLDRWAWWLALAPSGHIVVAEGGANVPSLLRFREDGQPDPDFHVPSELPAGYWRGLAIDGHGRILLGGTEFVEGGGRKASIVLLRLLPSGALDPSFGLGGIVRTSVSSPDGIILDEMTLASDGGVLVAGRLLKPRWTVTLVRYRENGSLDTGFGEGGLASPVSPSAIAGAILVQPDGRAVVGVQGTTSYPPNPFVLRLLRNGDLDPSFGRAGVLEFPTFYFGESRGVVVPEPGRVVLAGQTWTPGQDLFLLGLAVTTPAELQSFTAD